ncbi:MAG: hypothetical protein DRG78_11535 [Epsilonproteobacteria bacterium]|nr:MAG: hypothetical protein DRG78_11535 [Campylobacterota bacterium]
MKKVSLMVSKSIQNNEAFNRLNNSNRDNLFEKNISLKEEYFKYNYNCSTNDINSIQDSLIVLYFDVPKILPLVDDISKSFLFVIENNLIRPDNHKKEVYKYFNKVFTLYDDMSDEINFFKINLSFLFPNSINKDLLIKEKLCTLISANKNSPVKNINELYSERKIAIRWFEKNYPNDFDLYGIGWDKYKFSGPKIIRVFNRIPLIGKYYAKLTKQNFSSYQGMVDNKKDVMERYKFSICYENLKDVPGYITEKIFDSFFAGCVPIYWGANNITDYIPKDCFIDKRDFNSYEKLYEFMINMTDEDYLKYLVNIENYLNSDQSYPFSVDYYAKKIVDVTLKYTKENL